MKDLSGSASTLVSATPEACVDLLADVSGYPNWYPEVVRRVEVLERDDAGNATRARATLHVAAGPISRDLDLVLAVTHGPEEVKLERVPNEAGDPERLQVRFSVHWTVGASGASRSQLAVALAARLDVPRLVPLGGIGDTMANGFVAAAARAVDGRS
jgi:hypothetical protein